MRYLYSIISLFLCFFSFSQISDNFSDGDFTNNPTWIGDVTEFTVNTSQQLKLNATAAGASYLATNNNLTSLNDIEWRINVRQNFAPSGSNYGRVYLVSDQSNLEGPLNGYYLQFGEALSNDAVELFKQTGTTSTSICRGTNAQIAASFSVAVKVTRNASGLWSLYVDATGGSNYVFASSGTETTYNTSQFFGVSTLYTVGNIGNFFYDDIFVGPIVVDLTPPSIISSSVISSSQIDVLFSETVELTSAQTAANYNVNNGLGNPNTVLRDATNFSLVHLFFSTPFSNAVLNTLTVTAVADNSGNAITTATTNFTYLAPITVGFKDIVINEIFADPSPVINLTNAEFVELYNRSNTNTYNLNGLKLADSYTASGATLGNYALGPNSYVIICPVADTAQFTTLGYNNKLGVSSFPSLNNTGDNLYLKTNTGLFIDSVNYSDSWYQDAVKKNGGYTLEQINPNINASCSQVSNWRASNDPDGGTPGFVNSIYSTAPDVVAPQISSIYVVDSLHISVCFNDAISASQLNTASNYTINNGIGSPSNAIASSGNMCVILTLSNKLINATNYTISISGITDCSGNSLSPNTKGFSYYKAKPFDIVINELMPDPDPSIALPNEEYVELKNRTNYSINLKNWSFSSTTTSKKLPDVTIAPNGYLVLAGAGADNVFYNNFGIHVTEVASFPTLSNYGTTLTLRDTNNIVISSVSYNTSWYNDPDKDAGGWSMEQVDANNPCGGQTNWRASTNSNGGTPGLVNSVAANNPDATAPMLDRIIVISADTISLLFTEPLDSATLANPNNYVFDNGLLAPTYVKPIAPGFKQVVLKLSSSMQLGTLYNCSVLSNITDCVGNQLINGSGPFALPQAPSLNDVVINEILADPKTGGVEFVEIYNRSNKTINLKDLRIGSMDTLTNTLKYTEVITNEGYLFFPEQYLVLSESGNAVKQQYLTTNPKGFLDIETLPTLSNDDDVVTLSDAGGQVIDNLKYTSKMHFPLLVSTTGVSLERIDFNRPTNDKTNWNSAAEGVGFATPAYRNSQYLQANGGSGFTISNPLFSPDNDGYNDVLNISYKLDNAGKAANIYIYDSKGRLVRHLVRNEQLATDGTVSWNGINDDNEKAPIGIYVVYIELFDFSGKVNKYKLSCTLAGKLE